MASATVVLLVLGVLFLMLGWFWRRDNRSGEEMLVVLKSLANLKRDLAHYEERLVKLEDERLRSLGVPPVPTAGLEDVRVAAQPAKFESEARNKQADNVRGRNNRLQAMQVLSMGQAGTAEEPDIKVSERCQRVLDLAAQGLTTSEIAARLALSQDAVGMILKTYRRDTRG